MRRHRDGAGFGEYRAEYALYERWGSVTHGVWNDEFLRTGLEQLARPPKYLGDIDASFIGASQRRSEAAANNGTRLGRQCVRLCDYLTKLFERCFAGAAHVL